MTSPPTRADPGPQFDGLVRRLRAWSVSSWRHGDRVALTRARLTELADLAAEAERRATIPVPDVGPHALGDQLQVLLVDALDCGVTLERVQAVWSRLATDLGFARR